MKSVDKDLRELIEDTLECDLRGLRLEFNDIKLIDAVPQESYVHKAILNGGLYKASLYIDREHQLTEKEENHLRKILNIFTRNNSDFGKSGMSIGAEILDTITSHKSVDDVLNMLIRTLIDKGGFCRAGIMFLNEALLELRGVIFGDGKGGIDITSFRNVKVSFESKNQISDVMFYDKTEIISAKNVDGIDSLAKYFCGDMLFSGLGIGKRPIGVLVACKDDYTRADIEMMTLYSNICSLSIEFSKTLKQLELTASDLNKLRKTATNAENLVKMGRLSATVAHELKNPLVAIGGFTKRMEQTAVNPQTKNYIKIVQSEVQRLERIVGDILMYSRKVELNIRRVRLWDLIEENMEVLKGCLCFSMINVITKINPDLYIEVDRDKIRQVLMNLTTNSVQEMPDGGELRIEAAESEKHVTITVSDSGGGIPADIREKIFEPFYTKKKSGTGLGLPLCKKIMNAHGGDIVAGDCENGAVFTLIVPKRG